MKTRIIVVFLLGAGVLAACHGRDSQSDAFGNMEAVEVIVSAEGNGKLLHFDLEEGNRLGLNQWVGTIDTMQLYYKKVQLQETVRALYAKLPDIPAQLNVLRERLAKACYEKKRTERLLESGAATAKQLDDLNAEMALIEKEVVANSSLLTIQQKGLLAEVKPLEAQIAATEDLISKCVVTNPLEGTVLTKFAQRGELAVEGRPLYKIADVDHLIMRAYVGEEQLGDLHIGAEVTVLVDSADGGYREFKGCVTWVSDRAEFTPKVIQTKKERTNLVYAFKVLVNNDGTLKIGMPGEVRF